MSADDDDASASAPSMSELLLLRMFMSENWRVKGVDDRCFTPNE